jgi:hypothetical protein
MTELIIIFILWLIATIVAESSSISGTNTGALMFLVFVPIFIASLRRYLLAKKGEEHFRELQLRMKGVELNQQQVLKRLHDLEHAATPVREARPIAAPPPAEAAALRFATEAEKRAAEHRPVTPPAPVVAPPAAEQLAAKAPALSNPESAMPHPATPPIQAPAMPPTPPLAAQKETPPPVSPPPAPEIHPPMPAPPPPTAKPVTPPVPHARPDVPPLVPPHAAAPRDAARVSSSVGQPAHMHASGATPMSLGGYAAAPPKPPKPKRNWEETILIDWLPKIAIPLIVLGLAFFLSSKWHQLSPQAKIGIGIFSGLAILGLGILLERRERYITLGRVCIGGGWATIFVTTYAMRFFPGKPLLSSDLVGFFLLFIVAGFMVSHTLRYRSQLVTGAAFLLAYITVWVGHTTQYYSLTANALLSFGLIILVLRYNWFELEVLGILAAYLNHFCWLMPIEQVGRHQYFDQFYPSAGLLILYWAFFRGSYLLRKVHNDHEEKISTVAALLNSFGLLAVLKYQSVDPEMAFKFLLALGAVELGLAQLPVIRKRRLAFVMLSTIGASLLMAAFPFHYAPDSTQVSVLWLFEAEVFFLAGIFMREKVFRYLGMAAGLVAAFQILAKQGLAADSDLHRGMVFGLAAAFFYFNSLVTPTRWKNLITSSFELTCLRAFSFIAAAMAFAAVWVGFPNSWVPVLWAALAVALISGGSYLKNGDLCFQSYGFVAAAFMGVLYYDVDLPYAPLMHFNLRVLRFVLVALAFYLCAWRNHRLDRLWYAGARAVHSSLASVLLAVLIWVEFPNSWMAVSWMIFALALATIARYARLREFTVQSLVLSVAVLYRGLSFHLDLSNPMLGHLSERLVTLGLVTLGFYLLAWLNSDREWQLSRYVSYFNTWAAAGLVSLLVWYEVERWPGWIAVAWMVQAILLAAVMDYMTRKQKADALQFSWQSYLITLGAFARTLLFNFDLPHGEGFWNVRLVTVVSVAALLYGCAALRWQRKTTANTIARQTHNYAASLLLVLLGWIEYRNSWVAAIWILFALAAALVGRYLKLREFSIKSGLLAIVAVGRVLAVNFQDQQPWRYGMSLRLVTVGIVIAALYAMAPLSRLKEFSITNHLANLYTWMASGLLMTLVWYEMHEQHAVSVVIVWTLFALILFEIGMNRPSLHLRLQSYVALAASFARIFFANLNAFEVPGKLSPRVYSVAPLALAFYYVYERLEAAGESDTERGLWVSQLTSFLGLLTLGAIMRQAMDLEQVIIGWALLAAALIVTAVVRKRLIFYYQAVLAITAVAVRATLYNLMSERPMQMDTTHRPGFCVGITVALLLIALPLAFKMREWKSERSNRILRWIEENPHQIFFFVPLVLFTYLLERELSHAMLTIAWGLEGIIVFAGGLVVGVKSYRRSGLVVLLGLCLGKVLFDIFGDPTISRSSKALVAVVIGVLLGGVSFLGARYREIIREYL